MAAVTFPARAIVLAEEAKVTDEPVDRIVPAAPFDTAPEPAKLIAPTAWVAPVTLTVVPPD